MAAPRLNLLGGFDLDCRGARPLASAPRKAKALLAYLALSAGTSHPREKLAALLWGSSGEQQVRQSLRQALTDLRATLREDVPLLITNEAITLIPNVLEIDALEFARLIDEASTAALERAVALFRGDLLEGFNARAPAFEDWLALERNRLREQALTAMTSLLGRSSASGAASDRDVNLALRVLALDPLRESTHRALMQIYAKQGRYGAALMQYERCRRALFRELEVPPEQETTELFRELLKRREDPSGAQHTRVHPAHTDTDLEARAAHGNRRVNAKSATLPSAPEDPHSSAVTSTELRQVTVLATVLADLAAVAGGLEHTELREWLNDYYRIVDGETRRYGGMIVKHADEVVLSVFGSPVAQLSDTERAVRAAFAIQAAAAELPGNDALPVRVRIGIASGRILTDELGSIHHHERSIIGSCVAVATQLAQSGSVDGIAIANEAYQTVAARFCATELPDAASPSGTGIRAWRLGVERVAAERSFVGRLLERNAFAAALQACRTTGRGQTFLLRGEAGIGKSRLLDEFEAIARSQGFSTHKVLVLEFGADLGQQPLRALVKSLLGASLASPPQALQAVAEQAVARELVAPEQRACLDDLLGLPICASVKPAYEAMDESARDERKHAIVVNLVEAIAARQPLLIACEDIHWADATTLAQVAGIVQALARCRALLVLSTRSETEPLDATWRGGLHGTSLTTLDLAPLRDVEASALARQIVQRSDDFIDRCVKRAGGNPFFLEQLLRTCDATQDHLPHSVQSIAAALVDRLDPEHRNAARAAAVLGQRFSLDALQYLLDDPNHACEALLAGHLVRPSGEHYLFAHALIAEGVYGTLLKAERDRLHRLAATWFGERDPILVAEHLERAGDAGAARAYLVAARVQAGAYRNEHAMRLARRARELAHETAVQHEAGCLEGELAQELGAIDSSITAYTHAAQAGTSGAERLRAWIGIATGLRVRDRYAEALDYLARAEREATQSDELALIHFQRGNIMVPLGRTADCLKAHRLTLRHARRARSPHLEAQAQSGLGDAHYLLGQMRSSHRHFDGCIELCRKHALGRIEIANLAMRGATRLYAVGVDAALEDVGVATDLAMRLGNRRAEAIARNVAGYALYYAAQYEAACAEAERSLVLARALGSHRFEVKSLLNLGLALYGLGELDHAVQALDEAYAIGERSRVDLWTPWVLGALALATRRPERRRLALTQGENLLAKGSVGHSYLHFYQLAIEAALENREWRAAERYADALEAYTRTEPLPWSDVVVARARVLASRHKGPAREAQHEQSERCVASALRIGLRSALPALQVRSARATRKPPRTRAH